MRLASWNVNSVRIRLDRIANWLERNDVDVLAIQETKIDDARFPAMPLAALGYDVATHGVSQWNGVALLSRVGLDDVRRGFAGQPGWGDPEVPEARAIGAVCGGVRVWSLYIPNGRAIGDPHFDYKLRFLAALRAYGIDELAADPDARIALCGDFNIAPTDEDVWDPAYFAHSTHVTPQERAAFQSLVDTGFADVVRPFTPGPGVYTYWDYQQLRFPRREGMRIDFVLGSPGLAAAVTHAFIDREERKGKGPSDHAPVVVDLDPEALR
jgi:exodeoxyribonuclease-3